MRGAEKMGEDRSTEKPLPRSESRPHGLSGSDSAGRVSAGRALAGQALAGHASAGQGGYLYVYFSGEDGIRDDQQIRFAVSRDGLNWSALNDGRPILVSDAGDRGARDPFIVRTRDGFVIMATDLSTHAPAYRGADGKPDWRRMETAGRTDILVWRSRDLVSWQEPATPDLAGCLKAGNAWAPKAVWVPGACREEPGAPGCWLVSWSSVIADDGFAKERIYGRWTADFRSFSRPFLLVDGEDSSIDMLLLRWDRGRDRDAGSMPQTRPDRPVWLMVIKDERLHTVSIERSERLFDAAPRPGDVDDPVLSSHFHRIADRELDDLSWIEGPSAVRRRDGSLLLMVDEYASRRRGYLPLVSADPLAPDSLRLLDPRRYRLPPYPRHGSLLAIDGAEMGRLVARWGGR